MAIWLKSEGSRMQLSALFSGAGLGLACVLLTHSPANASSASAQINFSGTLVYPVPCTFNSAQLDVDLGDMVTTEIDGNNYRVDIDPGMDCTNAANDQLRLRFTGLPASDPTLLQTNVNGFAMQFSQGTGNTKLDLNSWHNFDRNAIPVLHVVPVKESSAVLTPGAITALATLQIEYQ